MSLDRRGGVFRCAPSVFLALSLAACADETSLLVRVTSPLAIPSELDALEVTVRGAAGSMVDERYALRAGWPHTVSVRPGALETRGVRVVVTGRLGAAFVARRVVDATFVTGRETVVEVVLFAECRGVECPEGVDCVSGACVGVTDSGVDGGVDGGRDAGALDARADASEGGPSEAATDTSNDAVLPDALPDGELADTGPTDAGCPNDDACADGVPCTIDRCVDGRCERVPDDTVCAVGERCDPAMGCPLRVCTTDADCDDRRLCNGAESCAGSTCAPGTPIDCDDLDPCTVDRCDEMNRGACEHRTRDLDGDGHGDAVCPSVGGVPSDDCDDTNADVLPGGVDVCNGLDDDCAGGCDERFTCCRGSTSACNTDCDTVGTRVCGASCGWSVCSPPPEICDGTDNDCNGAADDGFACTRGESEPCRADCGSMGTRSCDDACAWTACVAPTETCDGADNDCDAMTDEGFPCARGSTVPCPTSCGSIGAQTCDARCTLGACASPAEGCNGLDDDCDGNVDENVECTAGAMGSCATSCGTTGTRTCTTSCTWAPCTPPAESCNGLDDDCDGRTDETFMCARGATGTCAASCGTTGSRTCSSTCVWGACAPPGEICNGRDDNCNTTCDDGLECCAGTSGACMTTCGTTGTRTCSSACGWSACSPPAEACNGADDNCNGTCDDGFECCAGRMGSCVTACNSTGTRVCSGACGWGTCAPPAEACGGGDDDCDMAVDEGFVCTPATTSTCTTSCGSTGIQTCTPACAWSTCAPPTEACNGVDDDCDMMIDEGCGACASCPGSVTVSGEGGRYTQALGAPTHAGSCGGAGSEATFTFTTTATSDVFVTTLGGTIDTVVYVRSCACTGAEVGCNDDADGGTGSTLRLTALAAGTYHVFVDTKAPMSANVTVDVHVSAAGVESDRCGNPTYLPPGTTLVSGDTCTFGDDYRAARVGTCNTNGSGEGPERVYYFFLPTARTVTMSACTAGTVFDTTVYVRDVCTDGAAATQLACNEDGCNGSAWCNARWRSYFSQTLPAGLHYLVVDGYDIAGAPCPCGSFGVSIAGL